ncbi:glutamate--cysteine ligase [Methylocella silvestris]|uniref:Glutamate--cysteine ligase n=1 Tax=Methylocella silvestris TaxID=199596 RepID=A0A2J7TIS9_METSI|nr:glutamate--cysteine ligase [Methylocella silvestris]PNG26680.1 glutamate--cysteine ligase [Methylocella silvestris]
MARDVSDSTLVTSQRELVEWFEAGSKPAERFAIGTEHEKIPFYELCHSAAPYQGKPEEGLGGVRALLLGMRDKQGWSEICDGENIIGLLDERGGGAISLEPGGQFELSGAPLATIHETDAELDRHFSALKSVAAPLGMRFLALGMNPKWRLDEIPLMPKQRYAIMRRYMPKVGGRGLDMMFRTATVQANLDFSSEADMVKKLRVSLALQPVATALFANSPFTDGKLNGFLSARSEIWRDTDAARTGMLPFAFEPGMGFERYADYALDVPMYFVKRGETYIDVAGSSFRDLLAGRLAACPGERATLSDWANHVSTIFPEVRLKRYLEMRGADAGPRPMLTALPALFSGLLYDQASLDQACEMIKSWTQEDRERLRADTPRLGLEASIKGRPLRDIARETLALARAGLERRNHLDAKGRTEACFLDPLEHIVEERTEAERLIEAFKTRWAGSVDPAFEQCVY